MRPLVSIVIQSYNSRRFIAKCLDSVLSQDYQNWEVLVVINGSTDGSAELIKSRYGRYKRVRILEPGENLFFSRGNNYGIKFSQGDYVLGLNQDTIMTPSFVRLLVAVMEKDKTLGSASGKLLHYKFDIDSKTKILDSTGLEIFKTRRVIDRGQWEQDRGQYDRDTALFGASGAAALYRRSALEATRVPKADGSFEYFDEEFGAYKEDVDLCWRMLVMGYGCRYVPEAVVYHGRTVGRSWPTQVIRFILNRRRQSRYVRKLSFKNHYLMMVKNELAPLFWRQILYIFARELLLWVYTILFEPFQVFALREFFRQLPEARRKRRYIMARVKARPQTLRAYFH